MTDSLFRSGTLEMPVSASPVEPAQALDWLALPGNRILMVAAILLFFAALGDYLQLLPYIFRCLTRPREHVHIQHNMSLVYTRNFVALTLLLPFCLISDRYFIYSPAFAGFVPAGWSVAVPAVAIGAYLLLRRLLFALIKPRRFTSELEEAYHFALYNLFIALVSLMLLTLAVLLPFAPTDMALRTVFLVEIGLAFVLSLGHTMQILSLHCSALGTFLYLCALELIPAGLLLYSALR
jgi:hypothetical protein